MDIYTNVNNKNLTQLIEKLAFSLENTNKTEQTDAAVLVAITNEAHPKLLLTRRASHMNSHAGEVSFAGGKTEIQDDSNIATALREAQEETQLIPSCVHIIGQLKPQESSSGLIVTPIVGIIPADTILQAEENEIARIFWVDLEWFIETQTVDYEISHTFDNQKIKLQTPSWQTENEVIWGLTGRIIANMLQVGFDRQIKWYYRPVL